MSLSLVTSPLITIHVIFLNSELVFLSPQQVSPSRHGARGNSPLYFPPRNTMSEGISSCAPAFQTISLTQFIKWCMTTWLDTAGGLHDAESTVFHSSGICPKGLQNLNRSRSLNLPPWDILPHWAAMSLLFHVTIFASWSIVIISVKDFSLLNAEGHYSSAFFSLSLFCPILFSSIPLPPSISFPSPPVSFLFPNAAWLISAVSANNNAIWISFVLYRHLRSDLQTSLLVAFFPVVLGRLQQNSSWEPDSSLTPHLFIILSVWLQLRCCTCYCHFCSYCEPER